jgi:uncharacterized membrane protein YbhN (UPF0104 family)
MTRRALQIAVTLALFAALFWFVDVRQVIDSLEAIDLTVGLPALALLFLQNELTTRRWEIMLRAFVEPPSHFRMLRIQYMALFAQLFLPASVGGAAVRTGMLFRSGVRFGVAVNSVMLDRLVAMAGLILPAVIFMPTAAISLSVGENPRVLIIAGALALVGALVACIVALRYRPLSFWLRPLKRTPMNHLLEPLESAAPKIADPATIFAALAFSLGGQFIAVSAIFMLAKGSGLEVHLLDCILIMPPVMLLSALPISIAGWGVREGAMVIAFGLLGVSREAALLLSLQFAVLGYVSAIPGAVAWFMEANRSAFRRSADCPSGKGE